MTRRCRIHPDRRPLTATEDTVDLGRHDLGIPQTPMPDNGIKSFDNGGYKLADVRSGGPDRRRFVNLEWERPTGDGKGGPRPCVARESTSRT